MAKINFNLKRDIKDKDGKSFVVGVITFNKQRIRRSLKIKTKPKYWNEKKQRIRPSLATEPANDSETYNTIIDDFESKVKGIFKKAIINNIPLTKPFILDHLDNENEVLPEFSFFELFDKWVDTCRAIKADRTITGYITFKNYLIEFSKVKNVNINFESIGLEWFEAFQTYSFREKEITDNYFAKHVTTLKTFLNWATERGYNKNLFYSKFKAKERDSNIICLQKDELIKLYNFPFTSKKLEHVRDTFCFSCFTGQRFSDIVKLKKEHIINGCIHNDVAKTREFVVIPLIEHALNIISKYKDYPGDQLLPVISHQKYNDYIKECAKIAGLQRKVRLVKYVGGKPMYKTVELHEALSSHAARKTFITTSLTLGMSREAVKDISGHKKDATFNKYVKLSEEFKKDALEDAWSKFK